MELEYPRRLDEWELLHERTILGKRYTVHVRPRATRTSKSHFPRAHTVYATYPGSAPHVLQHYIGSSAVHARLERLLGIRDENAHDQPPHSAPRPRCVRLSHGRCWEYQWQVEEAKQRSPNTQKERRVYHGPGKRAASRTSSGTALWSTEVERDLAFNDAPSAVTQERHVIVVGNIKLPEKFLAEDEGRKRKSYS
ncbi:hypothetical protein PMIN01_07068 [Paraphaeosphaeria minitans]|uniref:Uncharacterized protein n=1 Tax=Paraphaeosphaeria minitans TaxID=565426 RepID=A0A9P6GHV4_9PLEO|nr:hypothetical protein PMIN01_07068 [Paraphaeosphaeria minitans]